MEDKQLIAFAKTMTLANIINLFDKDITEDKQTKMLAIIKQANAVADAIKDLAQEVYQFQVDDMLKLLTRKNLYADGEGFSFKLKR